MDTNDFLISFHQTNNKICWLWGHRWIAHFKRRYCNYICGRCGLDEDEYFLHGLPIPEIGARLSHLNATLSRKVNHLSWIVKTAIRPEICDECGQVRFIAGKEVGNHQDCDIPF